MKLGDKQRIFTKLVGILIGHAYEKGYELTFGDAFRDPTIVYGHQNSLHRSRLAIDLNLFKDGEYLERTIDHQPLGEFWESLHENCRWGGNFDDGNHYSFTHGGME
jgi:hypothetical protein